MSQPRLTIVPISLAKANDYVRMLHRHNGGLPAAKFALAVVDDGRTVHGVAVAGLPKARMLDDGFAIEVNRVCTDGTENACSALYGACIRSAKAMGYRLVVTYTLASESGVSLRAAGFQRVSDVPGESWNRRQTAKGHPQYKDSHDTGDKVRWEIRWERSAAPVMWPDAMTPEPVPDLFSQGAA